VELHFGYIKKLLALIWAKTWFKLGLGIGPTNANMVKLWTFCFGFALNGQNFGPWE